MNYKQAKIAAEHGKIAHDHMLNLKCRSFGPVNSAMATARAYGCQNYGLFDDEPFVAKQGRM
jgi:hypothetical protein